MSKQRSHSDNSRRESDSYGFSLHFSVEMPNLGGYFSVVAADLNVVGIDVYHEDVPTLQAEHNKGFIGFAQNMGLFFCNINPIKTLRMHLRLRGEERDGFAILFSPSKQDFEASAVFLSSK